MLARAQMPGGVRVYYDPDLREPNTLRREPDGSYTDLTTGQPFAGTVLRVQYDDDPPGGEP